MNPRDSDVGELIGRFIGKVDIPANLPGSGCRDWTFSPWGDNAEDRSFSRQVIKIENSDIPPLDTSQSSRPVSRPTFPIRAPATPRCTRLAKGFPKHTAFE
ncbi:hypothetical protein E2C01_027638 [Portunus trituberculatus]|uniref:Uncharacterized protein n=1 Tax=Portunus trituberculatus TaxID=210409 RepID=A0A5B7EPD5_PORTR|nr:hypothetical protein [Portunus trituberculatus]